MKPYQKLVLVAFLLIGILFVVGSSHAAIGAYRVSNASGGNLLVNGDFELEDPSTHGFIWYPPNHYVALNWNRWWVNVWPSQIPEYDDMRPGGRWPPYSGKHAQVMHKWGTRYEAGIYQVVENITPCVPYDFSMHVYSSGNTGTQPRARVGLDPEGTTIANIHNDLIAWPPYMNWSEYQTEFRTWTRLAVTTEALSNKLTAITYANPYYSGPNTPFFDTWWDYGSLYQLDFPGGKLPEPTSWDSPYLGAPTAQRNGDQVNIVWNSTVPASTQLRYTIQRYHEPVSPTIPMSYTVYLPFVASTQPVYTTALDPTPVTQHNVNITVPGLKSGDQITYWMLSRRPDIGACVTEGRGPIVYVVP